MNKYILIGITIITLLLNPLCAMSQDIPSEGSAEQILQIDVLDLKSMDVQDVIKLISQKTGLNAAISKNVQGRVTIFLKEINVYDALRVICETNGWAYQREDNVIQVMTSQEYETRHGRMFDQRGDLIVIALRYAQSKDAATLLSQIKSQTGVVISDDKSNSVMINDRPQKIEQMKKMIAGLDVPVETRVVDLVHAKAVDMAAQMLEFATPALGKVKADERSNQLIISDTPQKILELVKTAHSLDVKEPEVSIEAKIIQIALSDEHKTGVDWQGLVSRSHSLKFVGDFDILNAAEKRGEISIGTLAQDGYAGLIQALETMGRTQILSSPRITALNNKEAKILVGSTEPYVTTTITTPSSGPPTIAETVNFIDVGVKLFVTPRIHSDGFITMDIKPEVSSVISNLTTSTNNLIPVVETSEAETTVMIKDGSTIVIGGLMKQENNGSDKRIPLLGRIPLLSYAFGSRTRKTVSTEIAILLTPHIIDGETDAQTKNSTDQWVRELGDKFEKTFASGTR